MVEPHRWHPLLAAQEGPTGTRTLADAFDRVYGTIETRRVNATDVCYRASFRCELIGWSITLRLACERVHAEFLRNHGPNGGPVASWGTNDRDQPIKWALGRFDVFLVEEVERRIVDRFVVRREQRGIGVHPA